MFLKFFSLSHNPFRSRASGTEVFVGPQLAAVANGIQRALVERDAVCVVMGPVGAGKSVAVGRGLSQLASKHVALKLGRVRLGRDEILEELISGLGGDDTLTSTPRRIAELQRLLQAHEDQDSRVIVVVEDAVRLGLEGLIELEALTSPDTGDSSGANLILMGAPDLHELLDASELARLKQRISGRQTVAEFSLGETQGYLAARLRAAGGNAETLFPSDAVIALHEHSGGIARVINRLGGAVLRSAADAGEETVTAALIENAATDHPADDRRDDGPADAVDAPAPETDREVIPTEAGDDRSAADDVGANDVASAAPETANVAPSDDAELAISDDDIPELINDTLPEFAALKLPEGERTTADLVAELRDKSDGTQPSLPILTPDPSTPQAPVPACEETSEADSPAETSATTALDEAPSLEPAMQTETAAVPDAATELPPIGADVLVPALVGEPTPDVAEAPLLETTIEEDEPPTLPDVAAELSMIDAQVYAPPLVDESIPELTDAAPTETASAEPHPIPLLDIVDDAVEQSAQPEAPLLATAIESQHLEPEDPAPPVSLPEPPQEPLAVAAEIQRDADAPTADDAPVSEPAASEPAAAPPADDAPGDADTQTTKALDSALRPDTALFAALEQPAAPEPATSANNGDEAHEAPSAPETPESLPTLSESMRLEAEIDEPSADAASSVEPSVDDKPLELVPELGASVTAAPAQGMPEITLDDSIRDQQEAAQARLDAEAAEREAAAQAEAEKLKPSPAEQAAAAELAAEKERLADMPSIMDQLDDNAEQLPATDEGEGKDDERVKLKELADRLGGATSLEEVDDVAAETLFGVEFSQLANTVTAKALEGPSAPDEQTPEVELALEPEAEADLIAAGAGGEASPASPAPTAVSQTGANGALSNGANGANAPAALQRPEPGSLPDIESSAARRLEMVRSLNGKTGPVVPPPNTAEEIVLGEATPTPINDGPSPDRIEDQFGTSMTANLKALSMQNVQEMQAAEEEKEEKKRGFLSRFRRS